jgi:hypothetical protein
MVFVIRSGVCSHLDQVVVLQPGTTYTIGSGFRADILFNSSVVSDRHAGIRCDQDTGEWLIECLKEFTPPETSGLYFADKDDVMAPRTEAVLRHGTTFSVGAPWSFFECEVLDLKSILEERDELKKTVDQMNLQLEDSEKKIKILGNELFADEQKRLADQEKRLRLEEELSAECEKGEGSCRDKRPKV